MRPAQILLAVAVLALAVPVTALGRETGGRAAPPTFAFGRTGGNILPFAVKIGRDGRIVASGPVQVRSADVPLTLALRNGLATLARAEGFFSMPVLIRCPGVLPDVAGRFVTVLASGKMRTVSARGTCNASFEELYAVLSAVVGLG